MRYTAGARVPYETPGSHSDVQVAIWTSRLTLESPGYHLELQVAICFWRSRWPFKAPGGRWQLQVAVWTVKMITWSSNVALGVWRPVAPCGGLWQPVAACGSGMACWMINARLMEAEQGPGGGWMMNGRQIARRSHTFELEELGGILLSIGVSICLT